MHTIRHILRQGWLLGFLAALLLLSSGMQVPPSTAGPSSVFAEENRGNPFADPLFRQGYDVSAGALLRANPSSLLSGQHLRLGDLDGARSATDGSAVVPGGADLWSVALQDDAGRSARGSGVPLYDLLQVYRL